MRLLKKYREQIDGRPKGMGSDWETCCGWHWPLPPKHFQLGLYVYIFTLMIHKQYIIHFCHAHMYNCTCKHTYLHTTSGLHKLWYPSIRDTSTCSKFGAHGEHGDVFLFSNLGALWFSEKLIRYSLHVCLREVKNNLFSFKHSYLRHFSWRF